MAIKRIDDILGGSGVETDDPDDYIAIHRCEPLPNEPGSCLVSIRSIPKATPIPDGWEIVEVVHTTVE
jgi:hypothetical protein